MPDPLRHEGDLLASETGRETRIEELLLAGLDRLAPAGDTRDETAPAGRERTATNAGAAARESISAATLFLVLAIGALSGALVVIAWSGRDLPWRPSSAPDAVGAGGPRLEPLPVPSPAEVSLSRARIFYSKGRVRDALAALDAIRPGDPLRSQADDLRITIQRQLLATARTGSRAATPGSSSR